jgi:hypothetical protein
MRRTMLTLLLVAGAFYTGSPAVASDTEAKAAFKRMTDHLSSQSAFSVGYDTTLEFVSADLMKVGVASSGTLSFKRPDKIRMTRSNGLVDMELVYDGKALTLYGKALNIFGKIPVEGTVDDAIAMLRDNAGLDLPAADLLSLNSYEIMMENIIDAQALGEGRIRGQACDHLAFRTRDVDWQIWVRQGPEPFPCRLTITSKMSLYAPSYTIEFGDWQSGGAAATDDYTPKLAADAKEVDLSKLKSLDEIALPENTAGAQ